MDNPLTLAALTAFAASKPADEVYDYTAPSACLVAQFFESLGFDSILCDDDEIDCRQGWMHFSFKIPNDLNAAIIPLDTVVHINDVSFGEAHARLLELA